MIWVVLFYSLDKFLQNEGETHFPDKRVNINEIYISIQTAE